MPSTYESANEVVLQQGRHFVPARPYHRRDCSESLGQRISQAMPTQATKLSSSLVLDQKPRLGKVLRALGTITKPQVGGKNAEKRIEFIEHRAKQVLVVDCSKCSAREMEDIARKIPDYVTTQDRQSVLVLSDFTGTCFDHETVRTMKESAVFNKSYVKKSAWIGATIFLLDLKRELEHFSHRRFCIFESKDDALKWLTTD